MSIGIVAGFLRVCSASLCDGVEYSPHFLNQSNSTLKPIANRSFAFSRASGNLIVFSLSSDWLLFFCPHVVVLMLVVEISLGLRQVMFP